MAEAAIPVLLAADGGGSNCRMALAAGRRQHRVSLGPANVSSSLEGAVAVLREGLQRLSAASGIDETALAGAPAYLGLAGVLGPVHADAVRARLPLRRAVVEDDRRAAVEGALGGTDGAVAGLGTGSFFARRQCNAIRLAGGWGARLGDEASGFWIARSALSATLAAVDGLRPATPLTDRLLARFEGAAWRLVDFAATADAGTMAALAPLVARAAAEGDAVGSEIIARGAGHIRGTLQRMGWHPGDPLCLVGGLAGVYRGALGDAVAQGLVAARGTALDGALRLAAAHGQPAS